MVLLRKLFFFSALLFTILGNICGPKDDYDYDYYIKKYEEDDPIRLALKRIAADNPVDKTVYLMRQVLRERRLRAEELNKAHERVGRVLEQKNEVAKYREVLVVRTRVEYLEEELLPPGVLKPRSRREIWILILHSRNAKAEEIRQRVLDEYGREDPDRSISFFAEALQRIYGDVSQGVHKVVDQSVLDNLIDGDGKVERNILKILGVPSDKNIKKALKIVAGPLDLPNMAAVRVGNLQPLLFL